jgi:hypothetical protein
MRVFFFGGVFGYLSFVRLEIGWVDDDERVCALFERPLF